MNSPFLILELYLITRRLCKRGLPKVSCVLMKRRKKQYSAFVKEHLGSQAVSFHNTIKKNKISLSSKFKAKKQMLSIHVDSTKDYVHLLEQLYISLQVREGHADSLLEVENL